MPPGLVCLSNGSFTLSTQPFLIFSEILGFRLQIKIDSFTNILKCLIFGLSLGPAALQRRNMSHEIAIFTGLNYDLDVHGPEIIII